jgi:hypothetical protein
METLQQGVVQLAVDALPFGDTGLQQAVHLRRGRLRDAATLTYEQRRELDLEFTHPADLSR